MTNCITIQINIRVAEWSLENWSNHLGRAAAGDSNSKKRSMITSSNCRYGHSYSKSNSFSKSQKTLRKTVDEAKEANVKQDEKIEFLSEKIASNDSQVFYLASELKATQDDLASRNRQIKRLKFVQTEVDDDDKGYKSDDAGKRMKRDHMKKTQDFIRTTTKGSEQKQR